MDHAPAFGKPAGKMGSDTLLVVERHLAGEFPQPASKRPLFNACEQLLADLMLKQPRRDMPAFQAGDRDR